jgi:hypothetical protein
MQRYSVLFVLFLEALGTDKLHVRISIGREMCIKRPSSSSRTSVSHSLSFGCNLPISSFVDKTLLRLAKLWEQPLDFAPKSDCSRYVGRACRLLAYLTH